MFIPNYQIHNILKDFTLQLKKWRQQRATPTGRRRTWPGPPSGPDHLRVASVVNKVADNIMKRIASLGHEIRPTSKFDKKVPPRQAGEGDKSHPAVFDYYRLDPEKGKVKQRLVVKDSHQLVQRFEALTVADVNTRPSKSRKPSKV